MKTISRYIMTLALLITAASGAWAIGISCSPSYIGRVICTDGSIFVSSTEAAAEGKTAVAVIAYVNTVNKTGLALALTNQGQMNWENAKTSCADKNTSTPVTGGTWKLPSQSEWSQMIQGLGGYTAMNNVFASFGGDNLTNNYWSSTPNGNDKAVYYRSSNGGWGATSRTQNAVFVRACLEFNINLFISDDMTEATFAMPAYDATTEYELVRDMEVDVNAVMADRIRIKKSGSTYTPVDLLSVIPTVTDKLDAQNPVEMEWGTDYEMTLEKKGENNEWVATTDYSVGTFRAVIHGLNLYDGITYTNEFQLFEGYEVTVPAGEYVTYFKDENLYVEDPEAQLYTITSVGTETATATELTVAKANMPILVKNNGQEKKVILLIPTTNQADEVTVASEFVGTLEATTIAASSENQNNYAFNGKQFVWVKNAIEVGANRAWLHILTGAQSAPVLTIVFEGGTTKITNTDFTDYTDGVFYDLNGRKLQNKPTKKGVYIMNGRKVVVK